MSIEERYGDFDTYSAKLKKAIDGLEHSGFLLPVDATAALNKNLDNVLKNNLLPRK